MAEYFSHDYDAREDEKIIDMMADMGWAGYGLFWGLVELLYKNGGKMRNNYDRLAYALNSHPDHLKQIIENYGLFQIKNGFFTSKSIIKRLSKRKAKSEVASANARKRWDKKDAIALPPQSESNAKKESIVNKRKDSEYDHRQFYREEFKKCDLLKERSLRNGYYKFIGTIYNEGEHQNSIGSPVDHILDMPNPLSLAEYSELRDKAKKRGINILSKLKRIINNPGYTSGKQSLFLILEDWIEKEQIQGTNHG